MSIRTITAIFDSADDAQRAQASLLSLGVRAQDVRVLDHDEDSVQDADGQGGDDKGFWESIKDFFVADDDRSTYAEGVRRGGYLLTANVEDEYAEVACEILESSNAVDLEERAEQWRSEGWTDTPAAVAAGSDESDATLDESDPAEDSEEVIPVVRERLRVGKREVNRGGVRVRSYIVEEPVEEEVQLRGQRTDADDDEDGSLAPPPNLDRQSRKPGHKPTAR